MAGTGIKKNPMRLKILIHPSNMVDKSICKTGIGYAIEKEDSNGVKRRYLAGVSSGIQVDGHGDRMSEKCIKDFMDQTTTKDIPLYANHGRVFTDAIGLLTKSELTKTGDWYTEYRLFDDTDDVGESNKQEAKMAWKQANGLPPYSKPKQFGFSIEGFIPDGQVERTETGMQIGKVDLDPGVSLVSKPAYTSSVANAISKALKKEEFNDPNKRDAEDEAEDGLPTEQLTNATPDLAKDLFEDKLSAGEKISDYYDKRWRIDSALRDAINDILISNDTPENKKTILEQTFDSYKNKMIELYATIGFQTDEDGQIKVENSQSEKTTRKAIAKEAISKLLNKLSKEKSMEDDTKSTLGEVIAALQMLLEAENQEPQPDGEIANAENGQPTDDSEMTKALKALAKKLSLKKEDTPADDKKKEDEAEKALVKKLLALFKEGETSGSDKAETIIGDATPDGNDPKTEMAKTMKSLMGVVNKINSRLDGVEKGFDSLLSGFIAEPTPITKGKNTNLGQDDLITALGNMIAKKIDTEPKLVTESGDPIRANKAAFAEFFRQSR